MLLLLEVQNEKTQDGQIWTDGQCSDAIEFVPP